MNALINRANLFDEFQVTFDGGDGGFQVVGDDADNFCPTAFRHSLDFTLRKTQEIGERIQGARQTGTMPRQQRTID